MRLVLAVFLLAACSARASSGPAWPKMTEKETDGGESLAPRAKASAVAASESKDDDDDEKPAKADADKPATSTTPDKPDAETTKPAPTPAQADDVIITTEEIVIEIED